MIDGFFEVELEKQSVEDIRVNGEQAHYTFKSAGWRHPFVLYVDGVVSSFQLIHIRLPSLIKGSLMKETLVQ